MGRPCIGFRKEDGSNLRFEWQQKAGWCKFGTRHRTISPSDPEYGQAIGLFLNKYGDGVEKVIKTDKQFRGVREVVCFCEYFGPHSFGGQHDPLNPVIAMTGVTHNSPMDVVLFDVNLHKKGLLSPRAFLNSLGHLPIAQVIYEGNLTPEFVSDVREGKYPVVEGIVCKGGEGHKLWFRKVKTLSYLEELKKRFGGEWERYGE